jgi:hypothetical protein
VSHKDGRVVLSAWVEPVLRDYAREAAKSAGVQFSQWVEAAVRRAVAEESWAGVLLRQRSEARAALHRIAVLMQCEPDDDDDLTEAVRLLVSERDKARAERRQLRTRLVECLPFVGVCPLEPNRIQLMNLVRDLADDTLAEVQP